MPKQTPKQIADAAAEEARQRAAGRQKGIKSKLGDSAERAINGNTKAYREATNANWSRAAQESRMTGAARMYALQQLAKKKK
jgi:hypothetical protein